MMQNMKTSKTIFLASCIMVMILIGLNINGIIKTFLHAVQVDRQLYGQFRRLLVKTPNTDFKHKYETPYFRQYNLNTRTEKLGVCSWLKGKNVRVIARSSKGVFLVKMKNAFVPVKRNHSVNTYSRISTVPRVAR